MGRVCTSPDTGVSMAAAAAAAKRTTGAEEWWQILPERDECEHSHKSARRSITPPCHNRGPAKDVRKTVRICPRVGGHRRRRQQPAHPLLGAGRLRAGLRGRRQRGLRPRLVSRTVTLAVVLPVSAYRPVTCGRTPFVSSSLWHHIQPGMPPRFQFKSSGVCRYWIEK